MTLKPHTQATTFAGALFLLGATLTAACSEKAPTPPPTKNEFKQEATSQPASQPSTKPELLEATLDDRDYLIDGDSVPTRVGVHRIFARLSKVIALRDPVKIPGKNEILFAGKVAGNAGLFKMPIDGSTPATLEIPLPRFDSKFKETAKNRNNWFFGAPRYFPDNEHIIVDVARRTKKFDNFLGIMKIGSPKISMIEMEEALVAQAPDVMADGRVLFSACDEIRVAKLKGHEDQKVKSKVILTLESGNSIRGKICPIYRPRASPDGKSIVFEVLGRLLSEELRKKYNVPESTNPSDYVGEIWMANIDGSNIRRFVSDEGYASIGKRVQPGGSREPNFSPDGKRISFSHGRKIIVASLDGKKFTTVAADVVMGETNRIQFHEEDATWIDNNTLVSSSRLMAQTRLGPPGFSVIKLDQIPGTP